MSRWRAPSTAAVCSRGGRSSGPYPSGHGAAYVTTLESSTLGVHSDGGGRDRVVSVLPADGGVLGAQQPPDVAHMMCARRVAQLGRSVQSTTLSRHRVGCVIPSRQVPSPYDSFVCNFAEVRESCIYLAAGTPLPTRRDGLTNYHVMFSVCASPHSPSLLPPRLTPVISMVRASLRSRVWLF